VKIQNTLLEAFLVLARHLHFTDAAKELGITQSALSQRIHKLEEDLECALLIREFHDLKLTAAGESLFRYCQTQAKQEDDFLKNLKGSQAELAGPIRIGAFSSVLRSVLIPSLAGFQRKHPKVSITFSSHEVGELPQVLSRGHADLILMDLEFQKQGVESVNLGQEEYVVIQSARYECPADLYLDHSPEDTVTENFFHLQPKKPDYRRSFMGDVYSIIDGVALGYGKAVMSRHLIENDSRVKQVPGFKKYSRPLTLNYFRQPFYSKLQNAVTEEIQKNIPRFL
jgi:DNA-binding transcriptional LysR family regulator